MKHIIAVAVREVDKEIARLQTARKILAGLVGGHSAQPGKRQLSDEARKRIGDAQRLRWAKAKRAKRG